MSAAIGKVFVQITAIPDMMKKPYILYFNCIDKDTLYSVCIYAVRYWLFTYIYCYDFWQS